MPFTEGPEFTISLGTFFHWLIGGTLTVNAGLLLRIIWWVVKYYRRYKNAFMMYVEEHEELVADYNRRHPGQEIYFGGNKSKLHKITSKNIYRKDRNPEDSAD